MQGLGSSRNLDQAAAMFQIASHHGHLLASYNLAIMHLKGDVKGSSNGCEKAVKLLKKVSERGWGSVSEAQKDFQDRDMSWALYNYLKYADVGVELAQSNAAWMLRNGHGYVGKFQHTMAARMLRLSVGQGNTHALLPLGDAYWYGRGVARNWKKSARAYTEAGKNNVPQALFNLGYMHEYGLGVPQDFHLAKRYYDRCMEGSQSSYLPTYIALKWLGFHSYSLSISSTLPTRISDLLLAVCDLFNVGRGMMDKSSSVPGTPWMLQWSNYPSRLVRRVLSADIFDLIDGHLEGGLILWLAGLLGLVLWRRNSRRLQMLTENGSQNSTRPHPSTINPPDPANIEHVDPLALSPHRQGDQDAADEPSDPDPDLPE